jgi:hypothetical protein
VLKFVKGLSILCSVVYSVFGCVFCVVCCYVSFTVHCSSQVIILVLFSLFLNCVFLV